MVGKVGLYFLKDDSFLSNCLGVSNPIALLALELNYEGFCTGRVNFEEDRFEN